MAVLTMACAVAKSLTSPCTAVASELPALMRATTSSAAVALVLSLTATRAPSASSLIAHARPMPREAPVPARRFP